MLPKYYAMSWWRHWLLEGDRVRIKADEDLPVAVVQLLRA